MNGNDIIALGFEPGPHIPKMLEIAKNMEGASPDVIRNAVQHLAPAPKLPLAESAPYHSNIIATNEDEQANLDSVNASMHELMKTPVIKAGAIMPDACPAGPLGTIPVGGVVASEHIHPGMHSADICCSLSLTAFDNASPKDVLDAVHKVTHFGPGGRDEFWMSDELSGKVLNNAFLRDLFDVANHHMGTQGDGNHFAYVGTSKNVGKTVLVTHHGSRGLGARLYKKGMSLADRYRKKISPETLKGNAWIPADTKDGDEYWKALQIVRQWTKENHYSVHEAATELLGAKVSYRFWNEHNFVFRKPDGLFYHAKGATPAFKGWADDATDLTIIPLNMAEPILIVEGSNADNGLGFSPHGAGRNYSRTQHKKRHDGLSEHDIFKHETAGIDARFFMGNIDISELPSAYKNADTVKEQIRHFDLATVQDEIVPYGCIMAGDWEKDAPWRRKV